VNDCVKSIDSDLRFHHVHGKNARITNNGLTASRPRALGEFNEAIVIANRALRDGEMFEVTIDKMVARWSGAIEAGNCFSGSRRACIKCNKSFL